MMTLTKKDRHIPSSSKGEMLLRAKSARLPQRVWDNPDSFCNGALSSDILHALEKLNGKVIDKDVGNCMPNIGKTYQTPKHCSVPNPTLSD